MRPYVRPHIVWFLPVVLTLHCAEGSSFQTGDSGVGAGAPGGGGQGGEAGAGSGGSGTASTSSSSSSGAAGASSSSSSGNAGAGGAKDPCEGISCITPPPSVCKDANYLTVKESPGTCAGGNCIYAEHDEYCAYGCNMGECKPDPCVGVTCNMPPASYCSGPNTRVVYGSLGTCSDGTCSYTSSQETCAFGCINGFCEGDPCAGVMCNMPPASYCVDANNRVAYGPGTCSNGTCSYASSMQNCPFGCLMGVCNGDPCAGVMCNTPPASTCADANTQVVYGTPGTCSGGTCSYTPSNVVCAAGCLNGACNECSTNGDCPTGEWCNQMQCETCNTSAHCGPTCAACGGGTPQCLNGSTCVQCLTTNDCPMGQQCGAANTCIAGCTPPAAACTFGGSKDGGCANPYVVSRTSAGSASGYSQSAYGMCGRANDFASGGGCNGAGADAEYRLFMRAGESVATTVTKYGYCNQSASGNLTLKVFQAACDAACGCPVPTTCPTTARVVCQAGASSVGSSFTNNYTADKDGWYTFVVDTEINTDNNFQFTMTIKLTCSGTCGC